jgi:hypothetical protein
MIFLKGKTMTKPDYIIEEPAEVYHSKRREFLASHMLNDFRKCPELFRRKETEQIKDEDKPAYAIGRAAHCLILEGTVAFESEYLVGEPINEKTGKAYGKNTQAYQAWVAEQTKDVISPSDFGFISRLQAAVELHNEASRLLESGIAEGVVRIKYCGVPCQIRMDFFSEDKGVIDLKTCDDLTWFEADARRLGYIYQLAFYRAVLHEASKIKYPIHIIAVEKKEPFRCGVWKISNEALDLAEMENAAAIGRLKKCRAENIWPTGYEEIRILDSI